MSHTLGCLSHGQQCGFIISSDGGLVLQSEAQRERERQVRESRNIDCFVVSVLGSGPTLFKTELVQRDTVSPSQMRWYGSLYKDYQVFSYALEDIFCTGHKDST